MALRDKIFQRAFSQLFVYNILWEDAEVDERHLNIDESSSILSITGAGCGVAGMMSGRPQRLDAVDINRHHLALAALKVSAAQRCSSYPEFYDLFARGWSSDPARAIRPLTESMPRWMQQHWKRHHDRFEKSMLRQGLTAQMLHAFRKQIGIDANWLREIQDEPVERRQQIVEDLVRPILNKPHFKAVLNSPLQLVSLGINFQQRDRILKAEEMNIVDFFVEHLKRVVATDCRTNWFVWYTVAGEFNHEEQDAVPPYLRRDRWERSYQTPTAVRYHNRNLFEVMSEAGPNTWSHYTLCDAPDWLDLASQRQLLGEIHRTSRDGAIVLARSVEGHSMVENVQAQDRFELIRDASDDATATDRSRQYRKVAFYRVHH